MTATGADRSGPLSGALLAAAAAGGIGTLAFAPFGQWWLAPIVLAVLLALLSRGATLLRAAQAGFAFGLGSFGGGVSWVYVSLHVHGSMPAPMAVLATAGFCAYLALFPAVACALTAATPRGAWRLAAFPAAWTLAEWLRGWVLTGFTWQSIGYSQSGSPLAGWAPVGGLYAVTLATAASGAALWWLGRSALARLARRSATVAAPERSRTNAQAALPQAGSTLPSEGTGQTPSGRDDADSRALAHAADTPSTGTLPPPPVGTGAATHTIVSVSPGRPTAATARARRVSPGTACACAVALVAWLGGAVLLRVDWTRPVGEAIEVALLQGNVPQALKWREDSVAPTLQTYLELAEAARGAQLIIMPETAMPLFADRLPADYVDRLAEVARDGSGDILVGVVERVDGPAGYRNAVLSLGQSPVQGYRKEQLVPFGEFIPPLFGWVLDWLSIPMQDFAPGPRGQRPLTLAGQRVAVNICYEDSFARVILRQLPEATLLVNVSNTAWFGRSLAQPQHLQISQLRALETGRPMLRATNTGMTALIDPRGRVIALADPFTEAALRVRVQGHEGATPFVHAGNSVAVGAAFALLALVGLASRRDRA